MKDRIPSFPKYPSKPHASGSARLRIQGKDYYIGKHGSPESRAEYARLAQEFAVNPSASPSPKEIAAKATVNELVAAWIASASCSPKEITLTEYAVGPLVRLFGDTFAAEFSCAKLDAVRTAMITASWMTPEERKARNGLGWARSYTTHQIQRIRSLFRWAEFREIVPRGTWEHLRSLGPIPRNAKVRTTQKRKPVDFEKQVKPCLPHMPPQVAAMVQVQYYAGMRPGEVVAMRRNEIDMTSVEGVWLYRPTHHKTDYRGDELVKVIGPRGQTVMAPWLMACEPDGYVFPPLRNRYKRGRYDVEGYGRAIDRACVRAGVVKWSSYQLRHASARRAEEVGGLSGAAAILGHRQLETTQIYAGRQSVAVAVDLAKKIG